MCYLCVQMSSHSFLLSYVHGWIVTDSIVSSSLLLTDICADCNIRAVRGATAATEPQSRSPANSQTAGDEWNPVWWKEIKSWFTAAPMRDARPRMTERKANARLSSGKPKQKLWESRNLALVCLPAEAKWSRDLLERHLKLFNLLIRDRWVSLCLQTCFHFHFR